MSRRSSVKKLAASLCLLIALFLAACTTEGSPFKENPQPKLLVSITDPLNNDAYPVNGAINIRANAVSDESISKLELWIDGQLVNYYTPDAQDLHYLAHRWSWSTDKEGAFGLVVRAIGPSGEVAQSNIVNITASPDPGFVLIYKTRAGDTLEQIALDNGSSVSAILLANPDMKSEEPFPPEYEIRIPLGIREESINPPPSARQEQGNWLPARLLFKNSQITQLKGQNSSTASISAEVQGCAVILKISDPSIQASTYSIFRQNQGAITFDNIASVPTSDTGIATYVDDGLAIGKYQYYAIPYSTGLFANQSGSPSNIAAVAITYSGCAAAAVSVGSLFPDAMGSDQMYLYLTTNDKDWIRYPQGEFVFMSMSAAVNPAELAAIANPKNEEVTFLRGEGWAWIGGELVFLGTFEWKLPISTAPVAGNKSPAVMNTYLTTELEGRGTGKVDSKGFNWVKSIGFSTYDVKTLRWGTTTGADNGLWQVATVPFDKSPSLNPACLVLTGTAQAGTLQNKKEFEVDFSSLAPQPLSATAPKNESVSTGNVYLPGNTSPSNPPYSPQSVFKNSDKPQGVIVNPVVGFDPCKSSTNAEGEKVFYIRILPTKNGTLLAASSNTVVFTFAKAPPPISINYAPTNTFYDIKILEFTEMHVPQYEFANCLTVVENPWYKITPDKWGKAAPGSVVCPDVYQGEEDSNLLDDIGDFIEDAVNFVSDLYNDLSDFVTELVEKLNPYCIQAKFVADAVGEGQKQVKDVCHTMAVIAVTAAKTYVGLPPSLPNFEQLKTMGKDYVVQLAAEELEANGIPCPQECKDLISKGIDYSLEQVKSASSAPSCMSVSDAHDMGFEPLCPPEGVVTTPDHRGIPVPPLAVIQVTRRVGSDAANIPQPASCYATLNGSAKNDSYVGKPMSLWFGQVYFNWTGTSLSGPLVAAGAPIPSLSSGQSVKIPLVLDPVPFWLPGHYEWYGKWQNIADSDDWQMLYRGGNLTLTADGDCEFPGYYDAVTTSVVGETKYYGPLGDAYAQPCWPYCP